MVILSRGRDQADNAARVTARGAGATLKATAPSEKSPMRFDWPLTTRGSDTPPSDWEE
jgi:hypothetical protein